jgi:hypothetical protein
LGQVKRAGQAVAAGKVVKIKFIFDRKAALARDRRDRLLPFVKAGGFTLKAIRQEA